MGQRAGAAPTATAGPGEILGDAGYWPGVASLAMNAAATLLFGLLRANERLGWDSCLIATCEGNHIGSPVLLAVVVTKGSAVFLSALSGALALWLGGRALWTRQRPSRKTALTMLVLTLAFALEVAAWMGAGNRGALGAFFALLSAIVTITFYFSVVSGASLAAAGYGAVRLVTRRSIEPWPILALAWGTASMAAAAWWWQFTDRSF